jgi:uncharacterized protein (TIGR03435 family)
MAPTRVATCCARCLSIASSSQPTKKRTSGVADRTGLEGNFSAMVTYAPDSGRLTGPDQPATDPNTPSIFTALQEQLGLRLESTRGPVEVLVVDHIERPAED